MAKNLAKNIALHGSYYHHNFGDILMLDIMTKWIKEFNSENKVFLPHAHEEITTSISADGNGLNSLLNSDALIYGGGGYFGEPPSKKYLWGVRSAYRHAPAGNIMKIQKKPYAIIGVGVGPLTNPATRKIFEKLCNSASVLAVRDEESKDFLLNYGVKEKKVIQTSDMVMQLSKEDIDAKYFEEAHSSLSKLKTPIRIGIHIAENPFEEKTEILKKEILEIAKNNKNVGFVLLRDGIGEHPKVLHEIKSIVPSQAILLPYHNHWRFSAVLGSLDLVITTKLHVGITASALGKVALSFSAHGKTPRFYKQIGAPERCLPLASLNPGDAYNMVQNHLNSLPLAFEIPKHLKEKSKLNKQLLHDFLRNI